MVDLAPCGCFSHLECAICSAMICSAGVDVPNICEECISSNKIPDRIHPVYGTPLDMCKCGKIWNKKCAQDMSIFFVNRRRFVLRRIIQKKKIRLHGLIKDSTFTG